MPRSRPASNPLSFHKPTGQYYVTRQRKRIYLGADKEEALARYHGMSAGRGLCPPSEPHTGIDAVGGPAPGAADGVVGQGDDVDDGRAYGIRPSVGRRNVRKGLVAHW